MTETIRRRAERSHFVIVPNDTANDSEGLSLEALGLLTHLLHRPSDWRVSCEQIRKQWDIGRDKLRKLLGELRRAGYAELVNIRDPDTQKIVGREYMISSRPDLADKARENPAPENPAQGDKAERLKKPSHGKGVDIEKTESDTKTEIPLSPESDYERGQFEQFVSAFGFDVLTPIEPARKAFRKLSALDRRSALKFAPTYRAECAKRKRRKMKPHTWLHQKGWESAERFRPRNSQRQTVDGATDRKWFHADSQEFKAANEAHKARTGLSIPTDSKGGWKLPLRGDMGLPGLRPVAEIGREALNG